MGAGFPKIAQNLASVTNFVLPAFSCPKFRWHTWAPLVHCGIVHGEGGRGVRDGGGGSREAGRGGPASHSPAPDPLPSPGLPSSPGGAQTREFGRPGATIPREDPQRDRIWGRERGKSAKCSAPAPTLGLPPFGALFLGSGPPTLRASLAQAILAPGFQLKQV